MKRIFTERKNVSGMKGTMNEKTLEKARNILINYRKTIERKLPEGWKITTLFAPVQYENVVKLGKNRYMGYLRSRWDSPFSIDIYELDKEGKWRQLVFEHKSVDMVEDNPPLRSMKIIDRQLAKMRKSRSQIHFIQEART